MIPLLLLTSSLLVSADVPAPDPMASQAVAVCQQFVQVRLGQGQLPDEIQARPVPKRAGEWLIDGKIKGPEGPLLFACLLRHQDRWELLNFSLWAPQEVKSA